jgi:hypothetical protein
MAIMAITTSNSMSVKPPGLFDTVIFFLFTGNGFSARKKD